MKCLTILTGVIAILQIIVMHFMKFFKKHMGVPFVCYLNDYRLTMAARALAETQEDVLTVALDAGFPNVSYFNRLFKRKFQMTPLEYRKRGKKK